MKLSKPDSTTIWNAVLAAIGVALLGVIGYLAVENSSLKERMARHEALTFTAKEAGELSQKLTDVMTDIDKRIALIEKDVEWNKLLAMKNGPYPYPPLPAPAPALEPPTAPAPESAPTDEPIRKYDLRIEQSPPEEKPKF